MTELSQNKKFLVGLISDTHGHLPAAVHRVFNNVDRIVHAGDIGDAAVMEELRLIAPVVAVKGNMDWADWSRKLPATAILTIGNVRIGVIHDLSRRTDDFISDECRVIIDGHTHRAQIVDKNGILHVNPGSAGQPRGSRPASVALLRINGRQVQAELIQLEQMNR
jgi:hypothetical protein